MLHRMTGLVQEVAPWGPVLFWNRRLLLNSLAYLNGFDLKWLERCRFFESNKKKFQLAASSNMISSNCWTVITDIFQLFNRGFRKSQASAIRPSAIGCLIEQVGFSCRVVWSFGRFSKGLGHRLFSDSFLTFGLFWIVPCFHVRWCWILSFSQLFLVSKLQRFSASNIFQQIGQNPSQGSIFPTTGCRPWVFTTGSIWVSPPLCLTRRWDLTQQTKWRACEVKNHDRWG